MGVQFFAAPGGTLLDSQPFTFGDLPRTVEFLNETQGATDVVITTRSAENWIDNLVFSDTAVTQRDVAIAFDGSGSMASSNKWGVMIEAGDLFRDLYSAIDPADTFGGVLFRWDCARATGGSLITNRPAAAPLSTAVDIPAIFAGDMPQGCTPIGQGVIQTASMVQAGSNPKKAVLLLTDGINNRGVSVPIASGDPVLAGVTVHCIGLGSGTEINPLEINPLATSHGGLYRQTTSPKEILDFFAQTLNEILGKSEMAVVTGSSAVVATGTTKAIFLVAWDVGGAALNFDLQAPDGTVFNSAVPAPSGIVTAISYQAGATTSFHAFYVVEGANLGGTWTFVGVPAAARLLVVEDLALRIEWSISPKLGMTGDPIVLRARITENGKPFRGKAEVTARVTAPSESVGDLLAAGGKKLGRRPNGRDVNLRAIVAASGLEAKGWKEFPDPATRHLNLRRTAPGIYEREFTDTINDGVFRFDLEARSGADRPIFHRRTTLFSVLVSLPETTESDVVMALAGPGLYQVTVTFAAKKKRLLGPFLGSLMRLHTNGGKLVGALTDNLDGSYSQLLAWNGKGLPAIHVELLGKNFALAKPRVEKQK